MKYKTLFRLALKLVGVVFILLGAEQFVTMGFLWAFAVLSGESAGVALGSFYVILPSILLRIGGGSYLLFGAKWIVDKAIPSNRPYCPNCGYDLTGAVSKRCTECGTPFRAEDVRPPCVDDGSPQEPDA